MPGAIRIGTAGWSIPTRYAAEFAGEGAHLERYARRFSAAEINSSFHRPHRPQTYARWAESVPPGFRFAVKLPREISHVRKLAACDEPLARFLGAIEALAPWLGPLLVQLPPSLGYDEATASNFFAAFRARYDGDAVCEPRHASWFTDAVDATLAGFRIARVAADPARAARAETPGGWRELAYRRLHGSPIIYRSAYTADYLAGIARALREDAATAREAWCIFDNTANGEATGNAMALARVT